MQVGFVPSSHQVHGVKFGLQWFRRRQRSLARGVLALFCAAWLQAAVVPCVMAHAAAQATPPAPHHDHASMTDHDHHDMATAHAAGGDVTPCIYCPPSDSEHGSCDGHDCAFPHDPQVDARAGGVLASALPASFVLPAPVAGTVTRRCGPAVPEAIPRVALSISYCRFIE
jgi:hypothetical protein